MNFPSDMARARCAHLSVAELRLARTRLGVNQAQIDGPPHGMIVGEMPNGPSPGATPIPLFPFPASSSAGRLLSYSGLDPGMFLGRLLRRNLFPTHREWSAPAARERARELRDELARLDGAFNVLLLGARVGVAFKVEGFFRRETFALGDHDVVVSCIPHPSGQNLLYNSADVQRAAGAAVLWACGYSVNQGATS